ncbi:phage portal protein family protein [Polyangium spumosum]|uniref:DUF935 family protein n=2 Tax=Polyangium spumosum TaxID=889282 RepID=A0A6N7Q5S9_9BACT|nr:DUF935 family protein [Polyangium spumosum]MRG98636.1 DUF935 family protein [Polyangium spumosum]
MTRAPRVRYAQHVFAPLMGWDNDRVRQALERHEAGDFRESADLAEALLTDERLDGALQQRIDGLLALPLSFEVSTETGDKEAAELAQKKAAEVWWRFCPEPVLRDVLKWLIMLGVAVVQLNWTEERGQWLPLLEVWHPRDLWFEGHEVTYKVGTPTAQIAIGADPYKWAIFASGSQTPWMNGAVRRVAMYYLAKQQMFTDWAHYSEVYGHPTRVGKYPAALDESDETARERDAYQDALVNAGKSPVIMLPVDIDSEGKAAAGWDYELVQADGASAVEVFERGIRYCDSAAAMAILRQTLTMEPAPIGSHALGKVHNAVRHEGKRADTEGLATTGHFEVLRPWALFNFGDERLAPWPKWDTRTPEEREAQAEAEVLEARRRADVAKAEAEARRAVAEAKRAEAIAAAEAAKLRAETLERVAGAFAALGASTLASRVDWDALAKDEGLPLAPAGKSQPRELGRRALSGGGKVLHVVDGTYELFRAHFSRGRRRVVDGKDVKATVGMVASLVTLLEAGEVTHLAVAFDNPITSFRNKLFEGYKDDTVVPAALRAQFEDAEAAARALGVVVWSMDEFEADDALATACQKYAQDFATIRLLSPDKDLAQCLTRAGVVLVDRARGRELAADGVRDRFGVDPESIPDLLALVGDAADQIPGLDGVGIEAAAALLSRYGHIEDIPEDATDWDVEVWGAERVAAALKAGREDALLYRELATLVRNVPLEEKAEELAWGGESEGFGAWCERMNADHLKGRLPVAG